MVHVLHALRGYLEKGVVVVVAAQPLADAVLLVQAGLASDECVEEWPGSSMREFPFSIRAIGPTSTRPAWRACYPRAVVKDSQGRSGAPERNDPAPARIGRGIPVKHTSIL